jgi:hypothetical protein
MAPRRGPLLRSLKYDKAFAADQPYETGDSGFPSRPGAWSLQQQAG